MSETLMFWGEKRTIEDVLEDNRQLELKLFKIALKNHLIEMENQTQLDNIAFFLKPSVLVPILITFGVFFGAAYFFNFI